MKYVLFFLFLAMNITPSYGTDDQDSYPKLMYNYWELRALFNENFIINDLDENGNLTGDGIGEWDEANMRYSKAGYGLPIITRYLTNIWTPPLAIDWRADAGEVCNDDASMDPNQKNYIAAGDGTIMLGRWLATLSTEYELRKKNKQNPQIVLNELFLALQAYRRLDMTANRIATRYCEDCSSEGEVSPWATINYEGYTGFFIRTDIHSEFWQLTDNPPEKNWRSGGVLTDRSCVDLPNQICDIRDNSHPASNMFISQDQVIGLLWGLRFVTKYIPTSKTVEWDGVTYNLVEMAQTIAYNLVKRIRANVHNTIKHPGCYGEGHFGSKVARGNDATSTIHGMIQLLDDIYPEHDVVSSQNLMTTWAIFLWSIKQGMQSHIDHNIRFALELVTAADDDYDDWFKFDTQHQNRFMFHFAWAILNDKDPNCCDFQHPADPSSLTQFKNMLNTLQCGGTCHLSENVPGYDNDQGWTYQVCHQNIKYWQTNYSLWEKNPKLSQIDFEDHVSYKTNGIDYMLAYNIYHLAKHPEKPYFNPDVAVNKGFNGKTDDYILGDEYFCGLQEEKTYEGEISQESLDEGYYTVQWEVSPNLEIIGSSTGANCVVRNNGDVGQTRKEWIRWKLYSDNECISTIQEKVITLGSPKNPQIENNYSQPCLDFQIWDANQTTQNTSYTWVAVSGGTFLNQNGNTAFVSLAGINEENPEPFTYYVIIQNECGTKQSTLLSINLDPCENMQRGVRVIPNPVKDVLNIKLENFEARLFQERKISIAVINSSMGSVYSFQPQQALETVNVTSWNEGVYQVLINTEGNSYTETFVITKDY